MGLQVTHRGCFETRLFHAVRYARRSWTRSSSHVVTASRDGLCKAWAVLEKEEKGNAVIDLVVVWIGSPFGGASVTAIDIYPRYVTFAERELIAVGSESGDLLIFLVDLPDFLVPTTTVQVNNVKDCPRYEVASGYCHGATVKRIRWRATPHTPNALLLATCGEDHSVRVHRLRYQD